MKTLKCALYQRVSSSGQAEKGYSLDAQRKEGVRICKQNNWAYEVFEDAGCSANKDSLNNRPQLQKILDLAEDKKIQFCFVTELDRLSRSPITLEIIKVIFRENNVKVVTLSGTYDFRDEENEFMVDLLGLLAKRENKVKVRRSKRAVLEGMLKGNWCLGNSIPFGYAKEDKKLKPHSKESKYYKMIVKWSCEGKGTQKIADLLNSMKVKTKRTKKDKVFKWQDGTVLRILKNPIYKGEFLFKENKISAPSLITKKKWQQVQENLKNNTNNSGRNIKRFYLLKGLLNCKRCGHRLFGKIKPSSGERNYCCLSKRAGYENCGLRSPNLDKINDFVWNSIVSIVKNSSKLKEAIESKRESLFVNDTLSEAELGSINKAIKEKDSEISKILELYSRTKSLSMEDLDKKVLEIKSEKKILVKQANEIEIGLSRLNESKENITKIEDYMKIISDRIDKFTDEEKREFLNLLVDRIIVEYDEKNRIHLISIKGAIPIFEDAQIKDIERDLVTTHCTTHTVGCNSAIGGKPNLRFLIELAI